MKELKTTIKFKIFKRGQNLVGFAQSAVLSSQEHPQPPPKAENQARPWLDLEEQLNVTISDHLSQRMFRRSSHYSFDFNARVSDHIVFILIMFTVTSS